MADLKRRITVFFKRKCSTLIFIACGVVWFGGIWFVNHITNSPEKAGVLGDSAGAINALFSALAFAGVIIAMTLQMKELKLQRSELRLQRKELKATHEQLEAQKEEFQTQNDTLKRQRFENTFFQMMSLQQEIVNHLSFSYREPQETITYLRGDDQQKSMALLIRPNIEKKIQTSSTVPVTKTVTGRDVFPWLYEKEEMIRKTSEKTVYGLKNAIFENGISIYIVLQHHKYFDHYFRHLYRIIKFVDKSDLVKEEDKYEYTSMVRATLSRYELIWLFYNCLTNGLEKFKPLVEKYALLKNLRAELLADEKHRERYENGAYEYNHEV